MEHDPHWAKTSRKWMNQGKILLALRENPSTFTELLEKTRLSRPTLTEHLVRLENESIVIRMPIKGRRQYELTYRGKAGELLKDRVLASGFAGAGSLIADEKTGKQFVDMAKLAVRNPALFQLMLDWAAQLELFVASNPVYESRWLRALGGDKDEQQPFLDAISKRMAKYPKPKTPEEFRAGLNEIMITIKKELATGKVKK